MSRINRVPQGFQSLLASQNFGDNPSELSEVAAPVLELDKFLSKTLIRRTTASASASAIGAALDITIPEGQLWEPLNWWVGANNQFNAGGQAVIRAELVFPDEENAAGLQVVSMFDTSPKVILDAVSTGVSYGDGIQMAGQLYGPGTRFRAEVVDLNLTGASIGLRNRVLYRKYSI